MEAILQRQSSFWRWRLPLWLGAASLWLLPWVAMHYTDEVRWDALDFAVFGGMLAGAGLAWEIALRASQALWGRVASLAAIGVGFLEVWANLAVGIVGSERSPFNGIFFGILIVACVRACWVRVRAPEMVRVMLGTALAQALVGAVAWGIVGSAALPAAVLSLLWLIPAGLYSRAGHRSIRDPGA